MRLVKASVLLQATALMFASVLAVRAADDGAADRTLIGTWKVDEQYTGSLGASELIGRKFGDSSMPEVTLVISTNTVSHRYKKMAGVSIHAQAGQKTTEIKAADGTEYVVIDYNYKLNPKATPREIDFRWTASDGGADGSSRGIYKLEGSTLWLAISVRSSADRPKDYDRSSYDFSKSVLKAEKQ